MRKVILEIDPSTVIKKPFKKGLEYVLSKIEWLEGTNLFNIDPEQTSEIEMTVKKAGVFKIKLKEGFEISDLIDPKMGTIEPLEEENGVITCFIKAQIDGLPTKLIKSINLDEMLITLPLYLSPTKYIVSFLGNSETIISYLNLLKSLGISYKATIQHPDQFQSDLSCLTKRQKDVVLAARKFGYYEYPRRISSQELAEQLGISKSTMLEHLR
ncbi:MAG: helix-turn-helix domain-containing protein, partial [Promethearchaeota archaeon]